MKQNGLLRVTRLNVIPASYAPVLELQKLLWEQRKQDLIDDTLLILEHSPVYTIGKRGTGADILLQEPSNQAKTKGAHIFSVPRGGETTYHGPGQLVAYPIISLRAVRLGARAFVEGLEDAMIDTAAAFQIVARGRIPSRTGIWVDDRKLGAVGVKISHGVTSHGLALNVTTEPLPWFDHIIACGAPDTKPTSLEKESERPITVSQASDILVRAFIKRFHYSAMVELPDVTTIS